MATALALVLQRHPSLRELRLGGHAHASCLGDAGGVFMARALEVSPRLTSVDLSSCGLSDMAVAAMGQAIAANTRLRVLNLSANLITRNGVAPLVAALSKRGLSQPLLLLLEENPDIPPAVSHFVAAWNQVRSEVRMWYQPKNMFAGKNILYCCHSPVFFMSAWHQVQWWCTVVVAAQ